MNKNLSTDSPEVSIITVVFNGASTLEKTIKSVLTQTFASFEYVIVDGGSTDGTLEIIKNYQSERLIWISEPDKGIYDAMNKGIRLARGKWIYFLGSDDFLIDDYVLDRLFQTPPDNIDILYGNVFGSRSKKKFDGPTNPEKLLFSNLCHQSIFYKKEIHDKLGYYNLSYKLFADWEFNLRCFFNPEIKTQYINTVIAVYAEAGLSKIEGDISFLRNHLFPFNVKYLNENGIKTLRNIKYFDRWWRLLRSMKITGTDFMTSAHHKAAIPVPILVMSKFQNNIPVTLLENGFSSKSCMSLCYIYCLISNILH